MSLRIRAISLLMAVALAVTAAGAAQAGTMPVTAAAKAQDRIIKHSAGYRSLRRIVDVRTRAQARIWIAKDAKLQHLLDHAATVVSHSSASSSRQRAGRRDWVIGVRSLARGIGQLDTGFRRMLQGRPAAARIHLARARRAMAVADAVGTRADRLLRIPRNYA